jgi:hypothetical protein
MKNFKCILGIVLLLVGFNACKSTSNLNTGSSSTGDEQKKPLSYFNVYRGNSHSHTIFTWTHGEHRKDLISDLSKPTKFHPDWNVPEGVDWKDHLSINLNPEGYTVRQGLPDNHFELAIANGYDFYAITDHTQEPNLQPVSIDNRAWKAMLDAVGKYNKRPNFVALRGFEYSRNTNNDGGGGHINVINSSEYVNADHGQRGSAPEWPKANWSLPKFYNWVKSAKPTADKGSVVVGFNHPSGEQYNNWDHLNKDIVDRISTFEIHTNYKQSRWKTYIKVLNKGWKVSPIGVHDNHGYTAIMNKQLPPPTIVLAHELTLEAITAALREHRTFASWNEGVELRYSANGYIMGSTLDQPEKLKFNIEINTPASKPDQRVRCIQIVRNQPDGQEGVEVVAEQLFDGKDQVAWKPVVKDADAKFFLLRVYHANDLLEDGSFKTNCSTISAPVWTGR